MEERGTPRGRTFPRGTWKNVSERGRTWLHVTARGATFWNVEERSTTRGGTCLHVELHVPPRGPPRSSTFSKNFGSWSWNVEKIFRNVASERGVGTVDTICHVAPRGTDGPQRSLEDISILVKKSTDHFSRKFLFEICFSVCFFLFSFCFHFCFMSCMVCETFCSPKQTRKQTFVRYGWYHA